MFFFRALSAVWLGVLIASAPASAAGVYTWPLQVSQPVSVSNLAFPAQSQLVVVCGLAARPNATSITQATTTVPAGAATNGVVSYSGTVVVTLMDGPNPPAPPQPGNAVSCLLRVKVNGQFTTIGSQSAYTLP
jgi:hypothetical protein